MPTTPAAPGPPPVQAALAPASGGAARAPFGIDTVRRQFDRRAPHFGEVDAVVREVEQRLADRLSYICVDPARVLDAGCGRGASRAMLARLYPRARWLGVDLSLRMLADATAPGGAPGVVRRLLGAFAGPARTRAADRVCADAANLPLRDASIDLVFSNLMLHWHPQPHRVFPEFRRVLADGGLLMFSCFGPDTLAELRSAFRETNVPAAPLPFVDMHDFGDMLVASGFATPVMDAERLTLTFSSARALLREVSMLGGNPRSDRPRGLPSGERARALLRRLDDRRDADGRIGLTFEVAYGHAWKPAAAIDGRSGRRGADGVASVPLEQVRDALGRRRHRENEENDL